MTGVQGGSKIMDSPKGTDSSNLGFFKTDLFDKIPDFSYTIKNEERKLEYAMGRKGSKMFPIMF